MAEIITYTTASYDRWDTDANAVTQNLYTVLSAYDSRFSYTPGTNVINVSNKYNLVLTAYMSSFRGTATVSIYDSTDPSLLLGSWTYRYIGYSTQAKGWNVRFIKTEHTFYLEFIPANPSGEYLSLGGVVSILTYDNKDYFGIYGSSSDSEVYYSNRYIESFNMLCVDSKVSGYQVRKIANYKLNAFDLFFTPICVLVNGSGGFINLDEFSSCSNVTFRNTISTNNKNYYALGTNTLIELTEPE